MARATTIKENVVIPEGVGSTLRNGTLVVSGKKGELTASFTYPKIDLSQEGDKIVLTSATRAKKYKRMLYSFASHIQNMLSGVHEGHVYKLKICSGHFPMSVKVDGKEVVVNNFLGEKIPRRAKILNNVKVTISGEEVTVESCSIECAGQTAANIETATVIKNRDRRVFQDGIYIIERPK